MDKRQQLYYLLNGFVKGSYDIVSFCKAFEEIFYPDIPQGELTLFELKRFEALGDIVVRFSPFDEDLKMYPDIYKSGKEVEKAIHHAIEDLAEIPPHK